MRKIQDKATELLAWVLALLLLLAGGIIWETLQLKKKIRLWLCGNGKRYYAHHGGDPHDPSVGP